MARKYRLKRRAERQAETRQRIVDATVELHRELGPAQTTISAIAERAGVQRLTVYRHFPNERELMVACSSQYNAQNPPPDPTAWAGIRDPRDRFRQALAEIYGFYERTEEMLEKIIRDAETHEVTREFIAPYYQYLSQVVDLLCQGWDVPEEETVPFRAAIAHALGLATWRSLVRAQGLTNEQAVDVMLRLTTSFGRSQ
jgi:AcrR family transcriptional regulator